MQTISEKIEQYLKEQKYPFHMPGHKRRADACCQGDFCQHDFTEIDGFDNLYHAEGIIRASQERAAALFGADRTYFLVNGSTVGILASILACADPNGTVLVGPDCHKSVYHALELGNLAAVDADGAAIDPRQGAGGHALTRLTDIARELDYAALPRRIEQTLADRQGEISLVVVVSPTYEGVVSDIGQIARIAHEHGAILLVDEAHGAHFGMHPALPANSNSLGADLVVHSMHKTLSGLTQTALLHVNGDCIDCARIEHYLAMLQTSSPSYLLMESIDRCIRQIEQGKETIFGAYVDRLRQLRRQINALDYIGLFSTELYDPGKLVLTVKENSAGFTAPDLYAYLRDEAGLQLEFTQDAYALAMTSFADDEAAFGQLAQACVRVDEALAAGKRPAGTGGTQRGVRKTDCYEDSTD